MYKYLFKFFFGGGLIGTLLFSDGGFITPATFFMMISVMFMGLHIKNRAHDLSSGNMVLLKIYHFAPILFPSLVFIIRNFSK